MDPQLEFHNVPSGSMQNAALLDIDSDSEMDPGKSKLPNNPSEDDTDQSNKKTPFWSLGFFQNLFDVDTDQVLNRLYGALVPFPKSFLQHHVNGKPDLYGPFWICTTLVFSIAISGNLANYLQAGAANENYHWKYDFHAVTLSATAIYSYAWIVPLGLWGVLKWMVPEEVRICSFCSSSTYFLMFNTFKNISVLTLLFDLCVAASTLILGIIVCIWIFLNHLHPCFCILGNTTILASMASCPCRCRAFGNCSSDFYLACNFSNRGTSLSSPWYYSCTSHCFSSRFYALLFPCFSSPK